MDKPKEGDVVRVLDPEESFGYSPQSDYFLVFAAFDSLDESWDPWGESAWAQQDQDESTGKKGEWYIVGTSCDKDGKPLQNGESCSLGSYEVKEDDGSRSLT